MAALFDVNDAKYSLNDVYRGDCDISDAIIRLSGCLYLLPSELDYGAEMTGDTMMNLLNKVFDDYDYVLIDADSVGINSEVIRLNKIVQAALFVVKFDFTRMADIRKALLQISKSGLPVAGCIVNSVKTWRDVIRNLDKLVKTVGKKANKNTDKNKRKKV